MTKAASAQLRVHPAAENRLPEPFEPDHEPGLGALVVALVSTIRRHWKVALAVWLAVVLPTLAYALSAVATYTARGAIQVSDAGGSLASNPLSELVGTGTKAEVQTEVEIIRRPEFLTDVLTRVGMQIVDPKEPTSVTLDMRVALSGASPVDPRIRALRRSVGVATVAPGWFAPVRIRLSVPSTGRIRAQFDGAGAEGVEFAVGEPLTHPRVRLQFTREPLPVGESIEFDLLPVGVLLDRHAPNIEVASLGKVGEPTNIVQISVTSTDRETARQIVQTMMDRYLAKSLEWKTQSASQAAEFIEGQLDEVRKSLAQAEDRLKDYSESENAVQLDTQARVAIEQAAALHAQRMGLDLQEKTISSVLHRMQNGSSPKASVTSNFFEDPVLASSVQALTEAETAFETLRASHMEEHPRVQELGRALAFHKKEVASLMRSAQKNLAHQRQQLDVEIASTDAAMKKYPDRQLELARLMREMGASERVYTLLLEKHEEAQIMRASTTTDKRIVDTASLPHRRTAPKRRFLLLLGMLGGLVFALGAAFTAHVLQRKLDTVEAVREEAPFPTYGTVPLIAELPEGKTGQLTPEEVWAKPHEAAPEALRALAVSASLLPTNGEDGRVIMVTSSQPREGKSTISSGLAVAMARMGKRVLIIDLDLRKPVLHRVWKLPRAPGYSDLLGQGGSPQDLQRLAHQRSDFSTTVLTAGTPLPDTVAAIVAPALPKLLAAWSREYDWVILDSPPAFVAETAALAQHADLVLLVARPGVVERANLRHAVENLARSNAPRGLVLNAVGRQHTGYYYGSGYYYYHSSYGRDDAAEKSGEKRAAS